jgi:hypothetical protein
MSEPTQTEIELAHCRINLAQAQEQLAAVQYEFAAFKELFYGIDPTTNDYAMMVMKSWQNALKNRLYPKSHWIDALAITTRAVVERDMRANPEKYL